MHAEIIIQGVVQGVGYRFFAIQKAREYGITGYVQNLQDGSVLVVAEGPKGLLNDYIKELKIGPRAARVTKVSIKFSEKEKGYKNFSVKF
ncbi:MAG: acylphosphatase [candidate division WOR-3 bacterium]|nr:acylphosphatase [candidate division WOR-3 bacterium]